MNFFVARPSGKAKSKIFDLVNHPKAKRCYAWSFLGNSNRKVDEIVRGRAGNSADCFGGNGCQSVDCGGNETEEMNRKLKIALWVVIASVLIMARHAAREHHYFGWAWFLELANITWAGIFWFRWWRSTFRLPKDQIRTQPRSPRKRI